MTTETGAPVADAAPAAMPEELTMDDARAIIESWSDEDLDKKQNIEGNEPPAESARHRKSEPDIATAAQESPSEEEGADPETDPSDEAEATDPEDNLPPIERPRSWAKELDEEWKSYPRAAQERILAREQERDAALRRGQNEVAERSKALEAELGKAKQLQTEYEAKLPQLVKTLEAALQNDFADIQTMNDVRKLQSEDPFRFQQWQLRQMELAEANRQNQEVEGRKAKETEESWRTFVGEQSKRLAEFVPDAEVSKYAPKAGDLFEKLGFNESEREGFLRGEKISPFDHRMQRIVLDALKYQEIQAAPKAVVKPTVPPVQKPGNAGAVNSTDANIKALEKRFNASGSLEDAWALQEARLKTSQRRAS